MKFCITWIQVSAVTSNLRYVNSEVLNVKILRILFKLCISDSKFGQLMTLFSIENGFYLGKTKIVKLYCRIQRFCVNLLQ